MKTEIIHEDRDILVVYKPGGLASQTAKVGQQDVVSELKNYLWQKRMVTGAALGRPAPYLGIIHRLDQPVEGLLVFAKNAGAASALTEQLKKQGEAGMLHKDYYGVLCGQPAEEEGELTDYLYKSKDNRAVIVERGTVEESHDRSAIGFGIPSLPADGLQASLPADGLQASLSTDGLQASLLADGLQVKKAVLRYRSLQTVSRAGTLTLADIHIYTGRFHQTRAQMAHAGTPLLGDTKYGNAQTREMARTLYIQGVALCAYHLEFLHPVTGEKMNFRINPRGKAFSFFRV